MPSQLHFAQLRNLGVRAIFEYARLGGIGHIGQRLARRARRGLERAVGKPGARPRERRFSRGCALPGPFLFAPRPVELALQRERAGIGVAELQGFGQRHLGLGQ